MVRCPVDIIIVPRRSLFPTLRTIIVTRRSLLIISYESGPSRLRIYVFCGIRFLLLSKRMPTTGETCNGSWLGGCTSHGPLAGTFSRSIEDGQEIQMQIDHPIYHLSKTRCCQGRKGGCSTNHDPPRVSFRARVTLRYVLRSARKILGRTIVLS
jgi:hypothetical protein